MTVAEAATLGSPYKGLSAFEDSPVDALLFFGRERETEVVVANVLASRLTVLYGPSGVGKSSLLRAGVARELRRLAETDPLAVVVVSSWAGDPVPAIEEAARAAVADALGADPGDASGSLSDRLDAWTAALGGELVLLLDQLEEAFLYHPRGGPLGAVLAELVTRPRLRVNVLLGVRDDALAQLDAFKARLPGLFANSLRLDHLDRRAARSAVLGPLERWNEAVPADEWVAIEPALVGSVLDQVSAGRIETGHAGRGVAVGMEESARIEAPYLQLVLQRVWEVERERGSQTLRAATFTELGGAERIVEDHLDRAMAALTAHEQDAAAGMFDHLVTPSGTKIAHATGDLASFAAVGAVELEPVLRALSQERILRPLGENGHAGDRYEIYHDVLGSAVLGWRTRHETERALEAERRAAERRHRRLAVLAGVLLLGLALTSALAVYAFSQRSEAQQQTALAEQNQQKALRAAAVAKHQRDQANAAEADAEASQNQAEASQSQAEQESQVAQQEQQKADASAAEADQQKQNAQTSAAQANVSAQAATQSAAEADAQRSAANHAKATAVANANEATREKQIADRQRAAALANARAAKAGKRSATASALTSESASLADIDPDRSLELAVRASGMEQSRAVERALRVALVAEHTRLVLPGGGGEVRTVAYSPNGSLVLVAATGGAARLVRVATGKQVTSVNHGGFLTTAALSPDGTTIATAGREGVVRLWNAVTGAQIGSVRHGDLIRAIAFSPDGVTLASAGNDGFVRVWDLRTDSLRYEIHHPFAVESVEFSKDGRLLLALAHAAYVYDAPTGNRVAVLAQAGRITGAAFSPDGTRVVTGGLDDLGTIWDVSTGTALHVLRGHTANIRSVAFSPRGDLVATGSSDSSVRVWRADTGETVIPLIRHTNGVTAIAFSADESEIASVSTDNTARLWIGPVFSFTTALLGHLDPPTKIAFSPDGSTVVTASKDGSARIWSARFNPQLRVIGPRTPPVRAASFDPTGRLIVSGGLDGVIRVARLDGTLVRSLPQDGPVSDVRVSPDGLELLVTLQSGETRLLRVSNGTLLRTFAHHGTFRSAAFDRTGASVITAGSDGVARAWKVASGAALRSFDHGAPVTEAAFSPDGVLVATAGEDGMVKLWQRDGTLLRTLVGHTDVVTSVAFDPSGRLLVTASRDSDARLWAVATGRLVRVLRGHSAIVSDANFSPDGRWIVTAGPITAGLWETSTGRRLDPGTPLFFVRGPTARVRTASFDVASHRIVTASDDGTTRTYLCELCGTQADLTREARRRLEHLRATLTPAQRRHYLGA